jgi:oligopeptide transport system ATP-binding protein
MPPTKRDVLINVVDLNVHFPITNRSILSTTKQSIKAVTGLNFKIYRGETLGLVGESGCGKSTMGRALLQLNKITSGSVQFDGEDLVHMNPSTMRKRRKKMQMIFQDPYASLNPRMCIGDIIAEPLIIHKLCSTKNRKTRISALLELVGLNPDFAYRYPHEFSGGQRQRVGIARALAAEPEFIVADEALASLDVSIQAQLINLLQDLQDQLGLTYLFISHDLSVVRHISDRIAVMYLGRIVELTNCDEIYRKPVHPYTQALLLAVPLPDPKIQIERQQHILQGELPSPLNPPKGCSFSTRCQKATSRCHIEEPPLLEVEKDHWASCFNI